MKKGLFSTVTGFFLVVILVFGLIGFLGFYTGLVEIDVLTREDFRDFDTAKQFKDNLLICHGQNFLRGNLLEEQNMSGPCPVPSSIQGFEVRSVDSDCGGNWSFGAYDDMTYQVIPYRVTVLQPNDIDTCVSDLLIRV